MKRPECFNRRPMPTTYAAHDGYDAEGRLRVRIIPWAFEDRCTKHDGAGIGPNGESYADANKFDCIGCRWYKPTGDGNGKPAQADQRVP